MWLVDSSVCASDPDQPIHTWSQAAELEAESEEKGNVLILAIPIPSSLRLWFRLRFLIHTGTEGFLRFRFRRQCEPVPKRLFCVEKLSKVFFSLREKLINCKFQDTAKKLPKSKFWRERFTGILIVEW